MHARTSRVRSGIGFRDMGFKKMFNPHEKLIGPIVEGDKNVGKVGVDEKE
jgi:hypothetical protein